MGEFLWCWTYNVVVCCGIGLSATSGVGDIVLPLPFDVGVGDVAIVVAEESKINKVSLPVKKTMKNIPYTQSTWQLCHVATLSSTRRGLWHKTLGLRGSCCEIGGSDLASYTACQIWGISRER